jgi:hypothetical protein
MRVGLIDEYVMLMRGFLSADRKIELASRMHDLWVDFTDCEKEEAVRAGRLFWRKNPEEFLMFNIFTPEYLSDYLETVLDV